MEFVRKDGSLDYFGLTNLVTLILVSFLLLSNLLALFLSFPVVFEGSPKEYHSGISGNMQLIDVLTEPGELRVSYRYLNNGTGPLLIEAILQDGEVPPMPMAVGLVSVNGTVVDFILHDSFSEDGSWKGITIIPHKLREGYQEPVFRYMTENGPLEPPIKRGSFLHSSSSGPGLEIQCNNALEVSDRLILNISGIENMAYEVLDISISGFKGDMLIDDHGDRYSVDLDLYNISGWRSLTVKLSYSGSENMTLGPYLINFLNEPIDHIRVEELSVGQIFHEFDSFYDNGPIEDIEVLKDSMSIYSYTYHSIDMKIGGGSIGSKAIDDGHGEVLNLPLPTVRCSIEGKEVHLRPRDGTGNFSGIFRSPGRYGKGEDRGFALFVADGDIDKFILKKEVYLRGREAPAFSISPDPFHLQNDIPDAFKLEFREGWELTNFRNFTGMPTVKLDENRLNLSFERRRNDNGDLIYSYQGQIDKGDLLNGTFLHVTAIASYSMEITVSFIFFYIPFPITGMGIPIWFALISAAIFFSLLILLLRSSFKNTKKGRSPIGIRTPVSLDSDISVLSRTFAGAFFFSWSIFLLFNFMDQPTPGLDILREEVPVWLRMVLLAEASVWEEIVTRVMFIGLPLMLFAGRGQKWSKRVVGLLGGQGKFGNGEVILVLVSSSIFGLAHIGWGPWKVVPTFVSGALFGYLYIKVGLHAAIAMHFLFDYSNFIFYHFEELPYLPYNMLYIFMLLVGGFFLARIIVGLKWWLEKRSGRRLDPKWLLFLHTFLGVTLLVYLFAIDSSMEYMVLVGLVLPFNLLGFILAKGSMKDLSKVLISVSSLVTLALAPIGLIWIFDYDRDLSDERIGT